jgi:hypothetical protein
MRFVFFAAIAAVHAAAASLAPYALEAEARVKPVGLDMPHPRLSWKLKSEQSAYRILVATSAAKLRAGQGDLWDSGRIVSAETTWIPYRGASLKSFQQAFWTVRVWDAKGEVSPWSEPAEWITALENPGDWHASWIADSATALTSGPLPIFRKEVAIDKPLARAIVIVSGLGFHELHINGAKVGDSVLAPAWTNFHASVLYETFDVTALLHPGANALGVLLGNGFYNVAGGRYAKFTGSFGQPRLALQLHLEFAGGASRDISTDRSWRVTHGPITFSCIYGGEDYDARLEPASWDQPGFDDSHWSRPSSPEPPGGALTAQSSPPIRVQQTFTPVKVTQPKPGVTVYDLGQNFSGWPRIEVSGPAGSQIRLTPGELLDANGLVSQRSSGGPSYFTYTLRGEGRETWSPRFSYYGFRYVQVEGTATVHSLTGQFLHVDAPRAGTFHCSNGLLNRIHALIDAAIGSNMQHVLTDCPHREKLGWLEQSYLMGPSLLYNWDLRTYLPKLIRDTREAQTVDGLIPDIAPEYVTFAHGFRDSPEWGSAAIVLPWLAAGWYGDQAPMHDSATAMSRYAGYLLSRSENGLLAYGLGDWYDIGPRRPGTSQLTPLGVTGTATLYGDLKILGRPADQLRAAFQRAYAGESSQTSLAMSLVLGLVPDAARAAAVEKLVADIRAHNNHTTAGDIGYHYVIRALLDAGRSDVIFDMATRTDPPSYGAQLARGATSLTEAWDASPGSSQNHLMLGHIEEWFYAGLAGIRPDLENQDMRHVTIHPEPVGDITSVDATWETVRGPIAVHWTRAPGFRIQVDIPAGMTATLVLPCGAHQLPFGRHEYTCR